MKNIEQIIKLITDNIDDLNAKLSLLNGKVENSFSLAQADPGVLPSFLPLIFIFVIFYFLLIRPQSKKQKKMDLKRRAMKKNDQIILAGGIYGKVVDFKGKENEIVLTEIAKGVSIEVIRSSIVEVLIDETDVVKRNQSGGNSNAKAQVVSSDTKKQAGKSGKAKK